MKSTQDMTLWDSPVAVWDSNFGLLYTDAYVTMLNNVNSSLHMVSECRGCCIGWANQDPAKTPLGLKLACMTDCLQPKLQAAKRRKLMKAKLQQQLLLKVSHGHRLMQQTHGALNCI